MDKFHALNIFKTVARQGSFAAAARFLDTNPSTISKGIDRLEKDIGIQLFQRTTRQLRLTPAGSEYLNTVNSIFDELANCEEQIKRDNESPKGRLKVNTSVSYGRLYITPLIPKFRQRYPQIDIEITYDDAYIDMINQGYDVSIRTGSIQDSSLVAQQLSAMDTVTIASPDMAKKLSAPLTFKDFPKHPWLYFRFKQSGRILPMMAPGKHELQFYSDNQHIVVDDGEVLLSLCASGLGMTQLPHFLVRDALSCGEVIPVMQGFNVSGPGIFVIYPRRDNLPVKIRVFIQFLKEEVTALGETPQSTWARNLVPLQQNKI